MHDALENSDASLSSCILFWDNHTIVPGKVVQPLPPPLFSIKDTWRLFRVWLPDSSTWKCMYVLQIKHCFSFVKWFAFCLNAGMTTASFQSNGDLGTGKLFCTFSHPFQWLPNNLSMRVNSFSQNVNFLRCVYYSYLICSLLATVTMPGMPQCELNNMNSVRCVCKCQGCLQAIFQLNWWNMQIHAWGAVGFQVSEQFR